MIASLSPCGLVCRNEKKRHANAQKEMNFGQSEEARKITWAQRLFFLFYRFDGVAMKVITGVGGRINIFTRRESGPSCSHPG